MQHCLVCNKPFSNLKRKYCNDKCRKKASNLKWQEYHTEWNRKKRAKEAMTSDDNKIQCLICGGWYKQVGSHVVQVHNMTAREYRELYKLEVKRGLTAPSYRKFKGKLALKNRTYKNLEKGKVYRFKKGQAGIGIYERSPITLERIKNLHKFNKNYKLI